MPSGIESSRVWRVARLLLAARGSGLDLERDDEWKQNRGFHDPASDQRGLSSHHHRACGEGTEFIVLLPACGEDEAAFPTDRAVAWWISARK